MTERTAIDLFNDALELESDEGREQFLEKACPENASMRRHVRKLLAAHLGAGNFLPVEDCCTAGGGAFKSNSAVHESAMVGKTVGPYKIRERIGEGGMGAVYVAEQTQPVKRRVALKLIRSSLPTSDVVGRFEAERQALAMMNHPNIARVLDGGTTDSGQPYFAMELVQGLPITEYCDQRKLTTEDRLGLFLDVCRAVQHAHQRGIIHRDLKPSNILVAEIDDKAIVKVIDFGVAKAVDQKLSDHTVYTQFTQMIGTPLYMSPEQAGLGVLDIDTRSDVYSLGVLLYELLTGTTPFDGKKLKSAGYDEMRRMIREDEPRRPSALVSTLEAEAASTISEKRRSDHRRLSDALRGELDWIVMKSLEKDRSRRYESANSLVDDIHRFLEDEPVLACPPAAGYRIRKFVRRHRGWVVTAGTVAMTVLFALGVLLNERSRTLAALAGEREQRGVADDQRAAAEAERERARKSETEALRLRDMAQHNQYVAEMVSGKMDLEHGYLHQLNRKLMNHLPLAGQADRRGWEWYYLWSQCHPEVRTLHGSTRLTYANWSPDGKYIGAPGDIWNAETGDPLQWDIATSYIKRYPTAWSPDSNVIAWAMASDDSAVYLWDLRSKQLRDLRGHKKSVWSLAWSPDGACLASGGNDKIVRIWNVAKGETTAEFTAPDYVTDLAWSPDGELLVAASREHITVWSSETADSVKELHLGPSGRLQIAWNPHGRELATTGKNGWRLIRRSDWTISREQDLSNGSGRDLAWSPNGNALAVCSGETISLWDRMTGGPRQFLYGHLKPIIKVDWSPNGRFLVSSDQGGEIKIWDVSVDTESSNFSVDTPLESLSWLPDNMTLVVEQVDGTSSLWNADDGKRLDVVSAFSQGNSRWSPDRRLVACFPTSQTPEVRVLDANSGEVHAIWRGIMKGEVIDLSWSGDGTQLAIATSSEPPKQGELDVAFWNVEDEREISRWSYRGPTTRSLGDSFRLMWSPDSTHVAAMALGEDGDDGTAIYFGHVYVIDASQGATVLKHRMNDESSVGAISWSPDGRAFVAGNGGGAIEAVHVESGHTVFATQLPSTSIRSLAWSPDGNRIVSAAHNGSIKLITAKAGEDLLSFSLGEAVEFVQWSPAGNKLAAASSAGDVHIWDASRADELSKHGSRRAELARAYFRPRSSESSEDERTRLREALRVAPDRMDFWSLRGHAQALLGDYDRAAEEYAKASMFGLSHSLTSAKNCGLALLAGGQTERFERHCQSVVDAFADTSVPSTVREVAWLCCLSSEGFDLKPLLPRLRAALTDEYRNINRKSLVLGAALYRSGRFAEAATTLSKLADKLEQAGNSEEFGDLASARYFLAMARTQLGHTFQARRNLNDAKRIAENIPLRQTRGRRAPYSLNWMARVEVMALDEQARKLITDSQVQH